MPSTAMPNATLAVMIDPFNPLMVTEEAIKLEVEDYYRVWYENGVAEPG